MRKVKVSGFLWCYILSPGIIVGFITGFIILLLVFIFSVVAWELYRRDYK